MALTFPISASIGQTYQSGSSNTYEWTGTYWKIKNVINFNAFSASISQRVTDGVGGQDLSYLATTGSNEFIGDQVLSSGSIFFYDDYNFTTALIGLAPEVSGSGFPLLDNVSKDFVISSNADITLATALNNASSSNDVALVSLTRSGSLDVYANINVSGSIIPNTGIGTNTSSFSLGSPTNAWKELYISQGSIIFVDAATQATSSFTIAANQEVQYSNGITASYYDGDGSRLTNLPSTTNWNKDKQYILRNSEQLTFSGDYILEDCSLLIEGGEEDVQYAQNKSFKKEGSIFIGGNLLVKDSDIENNGKISVGGEVILIGSSQIIGTGTII